MLREPTKQFLHDPFTMGSNGEKGGATVFVSSVCTLHSKKHLTEIVEIWIMHIKSCTLHLKEQYHLFHLWGFIIISRQQNWEVGLFIRKSSAADQWKPTLQEDPLQKWCCFYPKRWKDKHIRPKSIYAWDGQKKVIFHLGKMSNDVNNPVNHNNKTTLMTYDGVWSFTLHHNNFDELMQLHKNCKNTNNCTSDLLCTT